MVKDRNCSSILQFSVRFYFIFNYARRGHLCLITFGWIFQSGLRQTFQDSWCSSIVKKFLSLDTSGLGGQIRTMLLVWSNIERERNVSSAENYGFVSRQTLGHKVTSMEVNQREILSSWLFPIPSWRSRAFTDLSLNSIPKIQHGNRVNFSKIKYIIIIK